MSAAENAFLEVRTAEDLPAGLLDRLLDIPRRCQHVTQTQAVEPNGHTEASHHIWR